MAIELRGVPAPVAVERIYIWAGELSVTEKDTLAHTLMSGGEVAYTATDSCGKPIGRTLVRPEDNPVTTVTEVTS